MSFAAFFRNKVSSPTTISRIPTKGSRGMLREQQSATQETMKATMRTRRPMIMRAATALAQAAVGSRRRLVRGGKKTESSFKSKHVSKSHNLLP